MGGRQNCDEAPTSHPTRQRWFLPPDPDWQGPDTARAVRQRLADLDTRLNVWWIPSRVRDDREQPGRWAVVCWRDKARVWSVVYYHEKVGGGFAPLTLECAEPMVNYLRSCEVEADVASSKAEAEKDRLGAAARHEVSVACAEEAHDMRQRALGVRQTFGAGYIRSRRSVNGGWRSENHERFLRSKGLMR